MEYNKEYGVGEYCTYNMILRLDKIIDIKEFMLLEYDPMEVPHDEALQEFVTDCIISDIKNVSTRQFLKISLCDVDWSLVYRQMIYSRSKV